MDGPLPEGVSMEQGACLGCKLRGRTKWMSRSHSQSPGADQWEDFFELGFHPLSVPVVYPHLKATELAVIEFRGPILVITRPPRRVSP